MAPRFVSDGYSIVSMRETTDARLDVTRGCDGSTELSLPIPSLGVAARLRVTLLGFSRL